MAHVKLPNARVSKLDDRSKCMIYLGTEEGCKAHRLYDPQGKRLHVSRDVVIEENKNWCWTENYHLEPATPTVFTVEGEQPTYEGESEKESPETLEQEAVSVSEQGIVSPQTRSPVTTPTSTQHRFTPRQTGDSTGDAPKVCKRYMQTP